MSTWDNGFWTLDGHIARYKNNLGTMAHSYTLEAIERVIVNVKKNKANYPTEQSYRDYLQHLERGRGILIFAQNYNHESLNKILPGLYRDCGLTLAEFMDLPIDIREEIITTRREL